MSAEVDPRDQPAPAPTKGPGRLRVILVEPEIAGNTGGIGRTCVAAGASLWLVRPLGFHLDDRRVRRAGLDYWADLDLHVVDRLDDALGPGAAWFFSTKGDRPYTDAAFEPGDSLVFGPESRGLPARLVDLANAEGRALAIPIRPEARSLNLGTAVAVAVFEAIRQFAPA